MEILEKINVNSFSLLADNKMDEDEDEDPPMGRVYNNILYFNDKPNFLLSS